MPEESDEGVYRTFHGQASVQVLHLRSYCQNKGSLSGGIGPTTHKILQLGGERVSIIWRERKEEGREGQEGGGEERDGED